MACHPAKAFAMSNILRSYYCKVCDIDCTSATVFDAHMKGKKHAKNLRKQKAVEEAENKGEPSPYVQSEKFQTKIDCKICGIWCNTEEQMKVHLVGKKHLKKARQQGMNLNNPFLKSTNSYDKNKSHQNTAPPGTASRGQPPRSRQFNRGGYGYVGHDRRWGNEMQDRRYQGAGTRRPNTSWESEYTEEPPTNRPRDPPKATRSSPPAPTDPLSADKKKKRSRDDIQYFSPEKSDRMSKMSKEVSWSTFSHLNSGANDDDDDDSSDDGAGAESSRKRRLKNNPLGGMVIPKKKKINEEDQKEASPIGWRKDPPPKNDYQKSYEMPQSVRGGSYGFQMGHGIREKTNNKQWQQSHTKSYNPYGYQGRGSGYQNRRGGYQSRGSGYQGRGGGYQRRGSEYQNQGSQNNQYGNQGRRSYPMPYNGPRYSQY